MPAHSPWALCKALPERHRTYEIHNETESVVLLHAHLDYMSNGFDSIATWAKGWKARLGNNYLLPKHKDPPAKVRPVAQGFCVLWVRLANISARILNYLVARTFALDTDWVLWQTFDARPSADEWTTAWRTLEGPFGLIGICCDATGMFLNLPHPRTLFFIDALCEAAAALGITQLSVRRTGRGGVFAGKPPDKGSYAVVTLAQVRLLARYSIKWLVSRLGTLVIRQKHGYPMGMPESLPLSVGLCAWDEWQFRTSLGVDARYLRVKRYVDDAIAGAFYRTDGGHPSLEFARALLDRWRNCCYDSNLSIDITSSSEDWCEFLDGIWRYIAHSRTVCITPRDKNLIGLLELGYRPIVRTSTTIPMCPGECYAARSSRLWSECPGLHPPLATFSLPRKLISLS